MENVRQSLLENIHNLQLPNRNKAIYKRYGKPPYSYAGMIIVAIMTSPKKMLSLSEIHDYLRNMFDFFKQPYLGWKDSVRHNLSHCKCFVKGGKTADGRNNLWTVNMAEVTPSLFRRQQTAIAKDGNYAEDLHDELQVPRIDIPFFNYSRGAPSKTTSDRPSTSASVIGATDYSCDTNGGNHGYQPTAAPSTAGHATDCHAINNCGPPTPVLYCFPSGTSANSPIVLSSPDKGRTTARPPSVLSTSSSSTSLRSLSEHPGQSSSPAFSDITEPRTPDMADNDMSGFRPINGDIQPGWITPLGLLRDSSDMTRGASCLSDVSPSRSECSSTRRAPKRKQIRHRPKVRKAMRTDNSRTSRTDSAISEMTYADFQTLVTQSAASQWEVSVDKAIGNLHVLCKPNTEAPSNGVATINEFNPTTSSFVPEIQTSEEGNQPFTGNDQQMTFVTGNGSTYIQTEQVNTGELATPTQDFHAPLPYRIDHTYSSPERINTTIPETKQQTSDVTWEFSNEPTTLMNDDTNSLEEFANCALWYGLLS